MSSSDHPAAPKDHAKDGRKPVLMLAEFDKTSTVLHAAEKLRDAKYRLFDAHTPFPIHGMDQAMGMSDSKLGWIVFACGLVGLCTAVGIITFMNGIDYPIVVGGKPPISIPSMIPVMFEVTVLFSAFGAVMGILTLNDLPRHNHPVFESERFKAATDDKFFISVETRDPKFDLEKTRKLLEDAHASHIETILDDEEDQ